ncbi:hypothetical protein QOZ80_8AG0622890 [Eleusine coracana subsp. coracana]|nr:hypothetical protein QOZ80_8AG0622890 [Eleusine coracana subsp. coracana]
MAFYVFEGFIITLLASLLTLHILIKSRRSKSSSFPMDWPILGMLPSLVGNLHNLQEYVTDVLATSSSSLLAHGPLASGMRFFATCDPANIRHIFTTNHANYLKGEHFGEIFDIMQGGLFTVDGESCRRQRGRTQSILSNPRIVSLMSSCSLEKVARGVVPFLTRMATTRTAFDLQDLITRFTFDFTVMPIFSVDPGLLSSEMPPIDAAEAMDTVMAVGLLWHTMPASCWKLMRWLNTGPEKKLAAAHSTLHGFIMEMMEKRKSNNLDKEQDTVDVVFLHRRP